MIEIRTLSPGEQTAAEVAQAAAGFIGEAERTLDLALYDVRLPGEAGDLVATRCATAAGRGVKVRIAYNADHDERILVPPPPSTRPELLEALPFPTKGIPGIPDLMHHKYAVRDGEAVWTGSANWTTDSWTLQENVCCARARRSWPPPSRATSRSSGTAATSAAAATSGRCRSTSPGAQGRAWFTPGQGRQLSHRIAKAIGSARRRVRIASPVITAGPILGTLAQLAAEGEVDLRGVVDRPQMEQVVRQWRENGRSAWKVPILASVFEQADFKGKPSTPWAPDTPHDFMHAKVTVADDTVFCGSFNLSRSGEHERRERDRAAATPSWPSTWPLFIDEVRARYEAMPAPRPAGPRATGAGVSAAATITSTNAGQPRASASGSSGSGSPKMIGPEAIVVTLAAAPVMAITGTALPS